ncbi:MAG: tetratricopeptide repeat protein [Gammaproteobacteria bacterium]
MLTMTHKIRASLLATLMTLPLAGFVPEAAAQTAGGWRKEVADKVQAAQAAGQKGSFTEAIRLLKEAKAKAPLSAQEEQGVNETLIWVASSARDHRLVIETVDERLATGRVSGADLIKKLRLKATTHYALREYRDAKGALDKLAAQGPLNVDDLIMLGNCQVQLRDYRNAATTLEKAVAAADKARKPTAIISPLLLALHKSYQETGNDAMRMQTLHRLIVTSPSRDSFKWVASAYAEKTARDPVVMINIYRLGASRGLLSGEHYAKYAETALDLSSPGEAVAMLEKGMANGSIKKDDRNNRVLKDAKSQLEKLKAVLPQTEKEAGAMQIGEPEAKVATAYFTLKNYAKASEAARRGVKKGKLKRPDDLNMLLGIALVETKRPAEARDAFKAAAAANKDIKGVADLWSSMAG